MGLFDNINSKYPLPLPENPEELKDFDFNKFRYQTKDLDESMRSYEIREDGSLWVEKHETKWVEGNKESKSFFDSLGHSEVIKSWWERSNLTRTVYFYDGIYENNFKYDYWIEFKAVFVEGNVKSIVLHKFEKEDNSERKRRNAEFEERLRKEKILWEKWYMKYLYSYYDRSVHWLFRKINKLYCMLPSMHKIENFFRPL